MQNGTSIMKTKKHIIIVFTILICLLVGTLCAQYPTKSKSKNELIKDVEKELVEYRKNYDKLMAEHKKQFERETKSFENKIKKLITKN